MNAMQVAQRYFDAWNQRDAEAIVATFAADGTYSDPSAGHGLTGQAIAAYAKGLWQAFPDLSFDIVSAAEAGGGAIAAQWLMRGTNTGSLLGLPPTGRTVTVPGADFIQVEGEKIRSVQGYFDSRTVPEQLGLQVVVQPYRVGPFSFGIGTLAQTGKKGKPGAFSITVLEARSEEEVHQIRELSRQIVVEMTSMSGFIAWAGMTIGRRMMTVTAWESPRDPQQLMRRGTHDEAMRKFFGTELAAGGTTSVWIPERINSLWVRCADCGRMADTEQSLGKCHCGQQLPEAMPYW